MANRAFPDSVASVLLYSLKGKELPLSEILAAHRGQRVVIDFWASWCRDCIVGLPKLNRLMEETAGHPVDYVFISLDKDKGKWRSAIKRFGIPGEHYRMKNGWKNTLSNYVGLDWIPRYLVLDETGRVRMPKAVSADEPELRKALLEL